MTDDKVRSPRDIGPAAKAKHMAGTLWETFRRAFVEFLTIPTVVIIAGFLLLSAVMFLLDESRIANKGPDSKDMWRGLFSDAAATRDFLGVIAADPAAAVVYSDNLPDQLMRTFESLAVVASESMQHQSAAEIYLTFANLFIACPRASGGRLTICCCARCRGSATIS